MTAADVAMEQQPGTFHELEKLLSLDDGLPQERVPTDDFFADYLHGLSTMAAQQGAAAAMTGPCSGSAGGACPSDSCTPPSAAAAATVLPGGLLNSSVTTSSMVPAASAQLEQRFLPALHQPAAAAAAASLGWQLPFGGLVALPGRPGVFAAAPPAVVPLGLLGMVTVGKPDVAAAAKNGAQQPGSRPQASNQRQATNREAQKRYRERQKARVLEMQIMIDRLQRDLEEHQGVHSRNLKLEEQHFRLQAQLVRAETEAEALQWQQEQAQRQRRQLRRGKGESAGAGAGAAPMDTAEGGAPTTAQQQGGTAPTTLQQRQASLTNSSAAGSAVGGAAGSAGACDAATPRNNSVGSLPTFGDTAGGVGAGMAGSGVEGGCKLPHSGSAEEAAVTTAEEVAELAAAAVPDPSAGMYGPAPPHEVFDDLLVRFQAQVTKVKAFLEEHRLRMQDPSTAVLPVSVRGQLLVLVQQSLGICRDLLRVEGVDVIELLQSRDEAAVATSGALPGSMLRQKWLHVLQVLHLTPEQKQQLLLQRTAHLALMRRIYQQRQQLNMQAMSLMLLPGGGSGGGAAAGGAPSGAQAANLATVLRLVKENLRREQRASMEINSCTLSRILTPVQAALYICEAFPLHCDALGMCNVLSTMGTGKTSSAAGSAGTPHNSSTHASSMG